MTVEQIHDALTLLPGDLIAEADQKRSRKPVVIQWKRYGAMAACFALVLCSSLFCLRLLQPKGAMESMKEAPAEAAVMYAPEAAAAADSAQPEEAAAEEEACALPAAPAEDRASGGTQTDISAENGSVMIAPLYPGISQPKYIEAIPAATTACFSSAPAPRLFTSREELENYAQSTIRYRTESLMEACKAYDDAWFAEHDLLLITVCGVPDSEVPEIREIRCENGLWEILVVNQQPSLESVVKDWSALMETEKNLIADADMVTVVYE